MQVETCVVNEQSHARRDIKPVCYPYVAGGSHAANASSPSAASVSFESRASFALLVYQADVSPSSSSSASAAAAVDASSSASAPSRRPPLVAHFRFLATPPDADADTETARGTGTETESEPGASVGVLIHYFTF